jgi:hypothetical protein
MDRPAGRENRLRSLEVRVLFCLLGCMAWPYLGSASVVKAQSCSLHEKEASVLIKQKTDAESRIGILDLGSRETCNLNPAAKNRLDCEAAIGQPEG